MKSALLQNSLFGFFSFLFAAVVILLATFLISMNGDLNAFQLNGISIVILSPIAEEIIRRLSLRSNLSSAFVISRNDALIFGLSWTLADTLLKLAFKQDALFVEYVLFGFLPVACLHIINSLLIRFTRVIIVVPIVIHVVVNVCLARLSSRATIAVMIFTSYPLLLGGCYFTYVYIRAYTAKRSAYPE